MELSLILPISIAFNMYLMFLISQVSSEKTRICTAYKSNNKGYEQEIEEMKKEYNIQKEELIKIKDIQEEKLKGLDEDIKKILDNPKNRDSVLLSLQLLSVKYFSKFEDLAKGSEN